MRAFIKFNRGILKMPLHWQLWLTLLVTANMISPLFFLDRIEAQVVLEEFALEAGLASFNTLTIVPLKSLSEEVIPRIKKVHGL